MSGRTPTVTIAGAGVLGWSIALALADAGCERVLVCDPGGPSASSVAAGMIAPVFEAALDQDSGAQLDLLMGARDHWPGLATRAGIELDRAGALAVGEDPWLERLGGRLASLNMRPTEIGSGTAQGLAPGLSDAVRRALRVREDWRVDAPVALAALAQAAVAAGVEHRAEPVRARGREDILVVATGAARGLVEAEPIPDWLHAVRDRAAAFADLPPDAFRPLLINEYREGAPIGWHRDRPVFDKVVGVSLLSPTVMRFRRRVGDRFERMSAALAPRSAYLLDGPARLHWEHSLREAKSHRYSLTFRNLRD